MSANTRQKKTNKGGNMIDKELILIILGCLMVYVFLRIDEAKRKKRERQERLNRIKFD